MKKNNPVANTLPGYRILSEIGRGNNGIVYLARQTALDREVALKVLMQERVAEDPGYIRSFLHEARLAARLDHPHIVQALDAGGFQGIYYFAMEYVPGESLEELRRRTEERLPLSQVLALMIQLADALDYAWNSHRMTHGDIKPGNLLLRDSGTNLKLTDLGLARIGSSIEKSDDIMVTPMYAAPEVISGENLHDPRSDIYSFAVMLYELVTGQPPFRGDTETLLQKHLEETPRPPLEIDPFCDRQIAAFLLRQLAKNPEERCKNWGEVLTFLQETRERLFPENCRIMKRRPLQKHRPAKQSSGNAPASRRMIAGIIFFLLGVAFAICMLAFFGLPMLRR